MKYYRDTYAEHPDDRENIEYTVPLENNEALVTLSGMYGQVKNETGANLEYSRYYQGVNIFLGKSFVNQLFELQATHCRRKGSEREGFR